MLITGKLRLVLFSRVDEESVYQRYVSSQFRNIAGHLIKKITRLKILRINIQYFFKSERTIFVVLY